jgi:glycosyltransferase involved in cell wall biosynthesis
MSSPTIVIPSKQNGWILEAIARDLAKKTKGHILEMPSSRREIILQIKLLLHLKSENYIFLHQNLFLNMYSRSTKVKNAKSIVLFTHQSSFTKEDLLKLSNLKYASKIIVNAGETKKFLISVLGQDYGKQIVVKIGGADLSFFSNFRLERSTKKVIIVSNFTARKRPDLIVRTVTTNPDYKFLLHGRGWFGTSPYNKLIKLANFEYREFNFADANELFNLSYVYLSLSDIEGGPMPALEALKAGCRVILTDTGLARDLKKISASIHILPVSPSEAQVSNALRLSTHMPPPEEDIYEYISYEKFLNEFISL